MNAGEMSCISIVVYAFILFNQGFYCNAQHSHQRRPALPRKQLLHDVIKQWSIVRPTIVPVGATSSTRSTIVHQRGDQSPPPDDDYDELPDFYPLDENEFRFDHPYYHIFKGFNAYHPPQRVHPCEHSSCYPATGNLLIGRENRLFASSTCGVNGPERFCIVSHLEEKKCFLCDTRQETVHEPLKNHRVGQIIYKNQPGTREQTWWQSENGRENVTIQLDMEAEFHFTHLIIVFATFRPAGMLVERSFDFGATWHVYRYFAQNCAEAFPGIPTHGRNVTDVLCDSRYSAVEPSKGGEVIYRVLPPNLHIENPYAEHVQNMLKMTNLRINFTKLHNLGDTLLDDRLEIQEKYYYAITNMVVRGSCSCYGHASRCLPLEGVGNAIDMVHGRCECTHNTNGLNCESCEDFFNDLPWKPALGKQTNACKKCNCNNHANSCHFDQAVYEHSGRVSGGVCDKCQHNTQGQHCEECMPFFYRDPNEDIQSPYVCKACDCDPIGALDDGICDSHTDLSNDIEAGACHCKAHVKGRRCDTCKDGFWNLNEANPDGCEHCTCHLLGTVNNSGCNIYTGECTCKRLVTGKDCNQCMPETYGLSDSEEGCSPCNCDAGGALDSYCDVITGQCRCRPNMTGRTCSIPKQNHYVKFLHNVYEAETNDSVCQSSSSYGCKIHTVDYPIDRKPPHTGPGYLIIREGDAVEFNVKDLPKSVDYNAILRYDQYGNEWQDAKISVIRPDPYDGYGFCAASHPQYETNIPVPFNRNTGEVTALTNVCLEKGKEYKFKIIFERRGRPDDSPTGQIYIDSLTLVPRIDVLPFFEGGPGEHRRYEFDRNRCNDTYYSRDYYDSSSEDCKDLFRQIGTQFGDGAIPCSCHPTGSVSNQCENNGGNCQCKPNIIGRQCDKCAPGYYAFGPEGCKACDCNSIGAQDNDCDLLTGQCNCRPNTYGRECNQCQPGFWNFPNCQQCECNGHSQTCDSKTGECIGCLDSTSGYNCDRCIEGYYGNPLLGSEIGCRPCRCPDTVSSGHIHADQCVLDPRSNDMVCYCKEGYTGPRCDVCAENYFGNPEKTGGKCEPCNCNNNIDVNRSGNCDSKTGQCKNCLYDTTGDNCEFCRDGFYGDALTQSCRPCDCEFLGVNRTHGSCDRYTGQCPCLKNVIGVRCDMCASNHWKIASGEGCEPCGCDPTGSLDNQCNRYDGQCTCREGFGGRQCDECETNYWGNPNLECFPCHCNIYGSAKSQCDRQTGQCVCRKGIGGHKCDVCDRGFLGMAPNCESCGECFINWDIILGEIRDDTNNLIEQAKQIKTTGATGAYTKEFDGMDKKLGIVRQLLDNTTVSPQDISNLEGRVSDLRKMLAEAVDELQKSEAQLETVYSDINLANASLNELRSRSDSIKASATELKEKATELQEANIEGALNLTRHAWNRVNLLSDLDHETQELNTNAERQCKRTEALLNRSRDDFIQSNAKNREEITQYSIALNALNEKIPDLNEQICDKRGDPCDSVCGGAGCSSCGGISCDKGALTKADKALEYVKKSEATIKEKQEIAEELIRALSQAKTNASDAYRKTQQVHSKVDQYLNETNDLITNGNELINQLTNVLNNNSASPDEIQEIAKKTLDLKLELDPEEINQLADQIREKVQLIENAEQIIYNTRNDLERVEDLKNKATYTKERAERVLNTTREVVEALNEAETAQKDARKAIDQAKEDIADAENDISHVTDKMSAAQFEAKETEEKVTQLEKRLSTLKKNSFKNNEEASTIKAQADELKNAANKAKENASQIRKKYRSSNETLTEKVATSESARDRAQKLLERASKITVDTTNKLKDLQGMVEIYKNNDKELTDLQNKINKLNSEVLVHMENIQNHAIHYRQCTS